MNADLSSEGATSLYFQFDLLPSLPKLRLTDCRFCLLPYLTLNYKMPKYGFSDRMSVFPSPFHREG